MDTAIATRLAEDVVADGFSAHRATLDSFVAAAGARGVSPVLLALVADHGAPSVARYRGLGRAVVEYVAADGTGEADRSADPARRPVAA